MKNFRLGLFGKRYKDTIVNVDKLNLGETNFLKDKTTKLGGIYNIQRSVIEDVNFQVFDEGVVNAFIINETNESLRTSILDKSLSYEDYHINYEEIDFLHIAYLDDIKYPDKINLEKVKTSVDFCTLNKRNQYKYVLQKCELIFDSRERKYLYDNLHINTPLILHDKNGCECVVNNEKIYESKIKPLKNINVNGAGDIFAGIFLKIYHYSNIKNAIKLASAQTKKYLTENEI